MAPREAITESVRTRVRPIFMTTMTSLGGLLPLVIIPGSGSELYRGLGAVVLGGLLVSTIFTLLLVPLLFSFVARPPKLPRGEQSVPSTASRSPAASPSPAPSPEMVSRASLPAS